MKRLNYNMALYIFDDLLLFLCVFSSLRFSSLKTSDEKFDSSIFKVVKED